MYFRIIHTHYKRMCGMVTILFRTVFMYVLIVASMRIMGKRQLGQMQLSEFITAMILSEVAALPISDKNIPLLYSVVPLLIIISMEVILSYVSMKSPSLQRLLESKPSVLISHGKLDQSALRDSRITIKELLVELRISGLSSISEADYVFLEPNGKFSIIPKAQFRTMSCGDAGISAESESPDISLIVDGKVIEESLSSLGKDRRWLEKAISPHKAQEVLYFSSNEKGQNTIIIKDKTK